MLYAILYIDKERRLRIFDDGSYNRERYVVDPGINPDVKPMNPGWCLEDDETRWDDEQEAIAALQSLKMKHLPNN